MKKLLKKVERIGVAQLMEDTRQNLLVTDKAFLQDKEDEADLEKRYEKLDISRTQRILINDYIACMKTADHHFARISYLAGIKDTVRILGRLGLIKKF
jgi:hypothetical protein